MFFLIREPRAFANVHVLEHSLVAAKMSVLRDKTTATVQFLRALEQIATQASKDWPVITTGLRRHLQQ